MPGTDAILQQIQSALEHEPRINVHSRPIHIGVSNGALLLEALWRKVLLKEEKIGIRNALYFL